MPPKMPRRVLRFAVSSLLVGAPLGGCDEPEYTSNPVMIPEQENVGPGEPEPSAENPGSEEESSQSPGAPASPEEPESEGQGESPEQGTEQPAEALSGSGEPESQEQGSEALGRIGASVGPGNIIRRPEERAEDAERRRARREEALRRRQERARELVRKTRVFVNPGPRERARAPHELRTLATEKS